MKRGMAGIISLVMVTVGLGLIMLQLGTRPLETILVVMVFEVGFWSYQRLQGKPKPKEPIGWVVASIDYDGDRSVWFLRDEAFTKNIYRDLLDDSRTSRAVMAEIVEEVIPSSNYHARKDQFD